MFSPIRFYFLIVSVFFSLLSIEAQELEARVKISTENLGAVEQSQYRDLENQLSELLNKTHWTDLAYTKRERIPCSFSLKLTELKDNNKYQAELSVSASRTAFNTMYDSPILVYVDKEVNFEWDLGTPLSYQEQSVDNNLLATFVFYAYSVIAMSLDSYGLEGSMRLHEAIKQLQNQANSHQEWNGWDAFNRNNRSSLISAITEPKHKLFREIWYNYHRLGLDICEQNIKEGRKLILEQVEKLKTYKDELYESFYLRLFEACKIKELVLLFQEAPQEERNKLRKVLDELFPTHQEELDKLRISQ